MNEDKLAVMEMLNEIKRDKQFMDFSYSYEFLLKWVSFCNSIDDNIQFCILD